MTYTLSDEITMSAGKDVRPKPLQVEDSTKMQSETLPSGALARKRTPIFSGVLMYFPDACAAVAQASWQGNEQHHPNTPLHWDRAKSQDEHDALVRHLMEAGTVDTDGIRHSAKVAWRALAALQKEIENERLGTTD
jgi:hypothetical protein